MAFINSRLPNRIAAGFQGGPEFRTSIEQLQNSDEYRNQDWPYPKHRYSAEMGLFSDEDRRDLVAAIWVSAGAFGTFRFKDWNDYQAVNEPIATVAGTMTPVQLVKVYTFGGTSFVRPVQLIVSAAVTRDGTTPVAGSYSDTTGLFTPSSNWVAGAHTWSGEFDVLVRFANDYNPLTARHRNARVTNIELREVTG